MGGMIPEKGVHYELTVAAGDQKVRQPQSCWCLMAFTVLWNVRAPAGGKRLTCCIPYAPPQSPSAHE